MVCSVETTEEAAAVEDDAATCVDVEVVLCSSGVERNEDVGKVNSELA